MSVNCVILIIGKINIIEVIISSHWQLGISGVETKIILFLFLKISFWNRFFVVYIIISPSEMVIGRSIWPKLCNSIQIYGCERIRREYLLTLQFVRYLILSSKRRSHLSMYSRKGEGQHLEEFCAISHIYLLY